MSCEESLYSRENSCRICVRVLYRSSFIVKISSFPRNLFVHRLRESYVPFATNKLRGHSVHDVSEIGFRSAELDFVDVFVELYIYIYIVKFYSVVMSSNFIAKFYCIFMYNALSSWKILSYAKGIFIAYIGRGLYAEIVKRGSCVLSATACHLHLEGSARLIGGVGCCASLRL